MDLEEEKENNNNSDIEYDVEKILDQRIISKFTRGRKPKTKARKKIICKEYLVKWLGYDTPTWEPEENLINCKTLLDNFKSKKIKKAREDNENNEGKIRKPKKAIPKKEKSTRIKYKKYKLNNPKNNKKPQNVSNNFLIDNNSNKNDNYDSHSLIDKKEVYNFLDNYNERDYNSGNDFDSIDELNLCSFKDGILCNKNANEEKESSKNSNDNNIILSSNSYNNDNKYLEEINPKVYPFSEFNSFNKEKEKENFSINSYSKSEKDNNNSINIITMEEIGNNILSSFGDSNNNEKENKNEDKFKIIDICGMEIPTDQDKGISLKIIYEKDNEQFIQSVKSNSGAIPKDILIKYYEMFIYDNYKGQNYGERLSSNYIV